MEIEAKKTPKPEKNRKKFSRDILFILVTMYNLYIAKRNMKKKSDVLAVSAFRVYSGKLPRKTPLTHPRNSACGGHR